MTSKFLQQQKINPNNFYTRHPHYPEVKLNMQVPKMTASTKSKSNLSSNNDCEAPLWKELSECNSAFDEPHLCQ